MKCGRRVATVFAALAIASTFGAGLVRAETTGDLYVASAGGILEVLTASRSVLDTLSVSPQLGSIAIRPDGRELYAISGSRDIVRVDLESMTVTSRIALPVPGAALAYPRGELLVAALPSLRRLAILDTGTGTLSRSETLPGAVDVLSADPRDGRVVAAARGGRWVAVLDPDTGSIRSTTIGGNVAAVAFDVTSGTVIIGTTAPNRLVGLDLRDLATAWSMPLPAAPSAVGVAPDGTFVTAGETGWSLAPVASPGWPFGIGASSSEPTARRWASLAGPAKALVTSDDGTYLYALESDRVEGFAAQRSVAAGTAAPAASRTVVLAGSRSPFAVVAVPGAKPLLGGPANAPGSTAPTTPGSAARPGTGNPGSPRPETAGKPPRTDTLVEEAARWIEARQTLPAALLVSGAILVLGLFALHRYERSHAA